MTKHSYFILLILHLSYGFGYLDESGKNVSRLVVKRLNGRMIQKLTTRIFKTSATYQYCFGKNVNKNNNLLNQYSAV